MVGVTAPLPPAGPTTPTPRFASADANALAMPPATSRRPLYKRWWFWTIAGGLFAGVVTTTYVVTRPPPTPYYGNLNGVNAIHFP